MKYAAILLLVSLFFSCNKEKISQLEEKNEQLKAEYELLTKESTMKNEFIEEYTKTINEVYDNLEKIRQREGFLSKASRDMEKQESTPLKEKMLSNISSIDNYLQQSKRRLRQLKEKMNASQLKTTSLEEMVDHLNKTLEEKERYIAELKTQTEQLNLKVAQVEEQLHEKESVIEQKVRMLNTVFYIIGTEDELKEKGIIEEKGGLFGLRKTKKLAAGFDTNYFTKTDMSNTGPIPISRRIDDVRIISPHNPESYHLEEIEERQTVLEITDPGEFWKIKYLVISYKG